MEILRLSTTSLVGIDKFIFRLGIAIEKRVAVCTSKLFLRASFSKSIFVNRYSSMNIKPDFKIKLLTRFQTKLIAVRATFS